MAITLAEANRMVQAAIAKAEEFNIRISVAVCDSGGRLVAFNRMDGAIWASSLGAPGKAIAAAAFGRPSGDINADSPTPKGYRICGRGTHDPRPGSRAHHPRRRSRRGLRRWWRHGAAGRGVRPRGGSRPLGGTSQHRHSGLRRHCPCPLRAT